MNLLHLIVPKFVKHKYKIRNNPLYKLNYKIEQELIKLNHCPAINKALQIFLGMP
jgi:hypothetical protein